jgi:hypothetical protein
MLLWALALPHSFNTVAIFDCIGIGIVFIPSIVFEVLSSYSPDNELDSLLMRQIEEATNSTLMVQHLPPYLLHFLFSV